MSLQLTVKKQAKTSTKASKRRNRALALSPVIGVAFFDPFPPRLNRTLVYCQALAQLSDGAVAFKTGAAVTFNLNSVFAPLTAGAHQPYGFDQLSPLYQKYKVTHVTFKIRMLPTLSTNFTFSGGLVWCVVPVNSVYDPSSSATEFVLEKPGGGILCGSSVNPVNHTMSIPIHQAAGITKQQFNADVEDYSSLVTASPAKIPVLRIAAWSTAATAQYTDWFVEVHYQVEFYDRLIQASS